jgi:cysteine desulfuration protein SufE
VTIAQKQQQLSAKLSGFRSAQDRLAYIVGRGRAAPPLEPAFRVDANRVQGCLAAVWFVARFEEGHCEFQADSDSAVIKGIAVLLCEFYSGQSPEEIVRSSPAFLADFGITQHLTPNRRNNLGRIWERIRACASAHLET